MTKQVRDWNKDMEFMNKKAPLSYNDLGVICYEIAPYWHEEAAAEKERVDRLESELETAYNEVGKLQKEYARLDETAANDYDQLTAAEAREKKLREAIEKAISQSWSGDMSALLDIKNELKASLYPKEEEAR